MIEIQAPNKVVKIEGNISIFLAGSIELGNAVEWQQALISEFKDSNITFLNPRSNDWDSTWEQSINNKQFSEQVNWELDSLESADHIVLYLDPNTKSPISLLELGLHATGGKLIVCCPDGFWRKANVDIVCQRNNILTLDSLDDLIKHIQKL